MIAALVLAGCGGGPPEPTGVAPYGIGPQYRPEPAATGPGCGSNEAASYVHLELFAEGKVMVVPAGIGIAEPVLDGAYARGGRCRHALFTTEPTGVIGVAREDLTLGDLFTIWDKPLTSNRLLSFDQPVRVHVDGEPWSGDPRAVPLTDHAQIVVEAGGPPIEPHTSYVFGE